MSICSLVWHGEECLMDYLCNAFSLNMLEKEEDFALLRVSKIEGGDIPPNAISAVGYTDTAAVLTGILGFKVEANRISLKLTHDDTLYVAQYHGPRFPEGTVVLPDGSTFDFYKVTFCLDMCDECYSLDCNLCMYRKLGYTSKV